MTSPPPPPPDNQNQTPQPAKAWHMWTLGELAQKASLLGSALVAGYQAVKQTIAEKDSSK